MSQIQSLYDALSKVPVLGPHLFSVGFAQKAPYFASIRPHFVELRPNYAAVRIRRRRGVQNHLGTIHAIALCNGLEAAMGALAEATVPANKRWIPKGMEVTYTAKADADVLCVAQTDPAQWTSDDPDLPVRVWGVKPDGTVVIEGVIRLWVTRKPGR